MNRDKNKTFMSKGSIASRGSMKLHIMEIP